MKLIHFITLPLMCLVLAGCTDHKEKNTGRTKHTHRPAIVRSGDTDRKAETTHRKKSTHAAPPLSAPATRIIKQKQLLQSSFWKSIPC